MHLEKKWFELSFNAKFSHFDTSNFTTLFFLDLCKFTVPQLTLTVALAAYVVLKLYYRTVALATYVVFRSTLSEHYFRQHRA